MILLSYQNTGIDETSSPLGLSTALRYLVPPTASTRPAY
jgi:hypothetical protein